MLEESERNLGIISINLYSWGERVQGTRPETAGKPIGATPSAAGKDSSAAYKRMNQRRDRREVEKRKTLHKEEQRLLEVRSLAA